MPISIVGDATDEEEQTSDRTTQIPIQLATSTTATTFLQHDQQLPHNSRTAAVRLFSLVALCKSSRWFQLFSICSANQSLQTIVQELE